jgi:hypothetical protein
MHRVKKWLLALFIVFLAIQFIQPARNHSGQVALSEISECIPVPDNVLAVIKNSCYDCHSNNTRYPWYSFIQPGGWWMASHIKKGKKNLNFDEFGNYSIVKQKSKLKSIANSINDGTMPIPSYLLLHNAAHLSKEDKKLIIDWANTNLDSLTNKN